MCSPNRPAPSGGTAQVLPAPRRARPRPPCSRRRLPRAFPASLHFGTPARPFDLRPSPPPRSACKRRVSRQGEPLAPIPSFHGHAFPSRRLPPRCSRGPLGPRGLTRRPFPAPSLPAREGRSTQGGGSPHLEGARRRNHGRTRGWRRGLCPQPLCAGALGDTTQAPRDAGSVLGTRSSLSRLCRSGCSEKAFQLPVSRDLRLGAPESRPPTTSPSSQAAKPGAVFRSCP